MSGAEVAGERRETALRGFRCAASWLGRLRADRAARADRRRSRACACRAGASPVAALGVGALFARRGAARVRPRHGRSHSSTARGARAVGGRRARRRVRPRGVRARAPRHVLALRPRGRRRRGARAHRRRAAARRRARRATAMFTDLRGFTTSPEALDAEEVIGLLNGYLGEISDAVLAHGGTLVSYLGDGLMAVFGAPLRRTTTPTARSPRRARCSRCGCRSSTSGCASRASSRLQDGHRAEQRAVHVRQRRLQRRLEYTAIGDTINTASRIEGMTKGTPYALFVADSTARR